MLPFLPEVIDIQFPRRTNAVQKPLIGATFFKRPALLKFNMLVSNYFWFSLYYTLLLTILGIMYFDFQNQRLVFMYINYLLQFLGKKLPVGCPQNK